MTSLQKQDLLQGVTHALQLFPFALAVGVCSPFGWTGGLIACIAALLFGLVFRVPMLPGFLSLLPVFLLAFRYGAAHACAAVVLSGVFLFFLSLLPQDKREKLTSQAVSAGLSVAVAFTTTALITTDYFGIGAVGGTVPEIIRDYISLGFHPNWRGILYGTIVMVVLITYPRKFKTLSKKLPAVFVSLLITVPLHLLLVPDRVHSPIAEVRFAAAQTWLSNAIPNGAFSLQALPLTVFSAVSLSLLVAAGQDARAARCLSVSSLCGGFAGAAPLQCAETPCGRSGALIAIPLTLLLYIGVSFLRVPVPSLAVILIVTAWQRVPWHEVRLSLGVRKIAFLLCAVLLPVLFGLHYAVPALALLSLVENRLLPANSK